MNNSNKTVFYWKLGQCCQFHNTALAKLYNFGTTTKTSALTAQGKQKVQEKALSNANKLLRIMQHFSTKPHNLRCFRISSELFPCYTLDFTKDWYLEIEDQLHSILSKAGTVAQQHNIRLSTHPGQFTVLGSNNPDVVVNSIKDIEYHAMFGQMLGLSAADFVVNIHLQGLYGGKHIDGINRFATHYTYLSDYAQQCLAVENEDKPKSGYDIEHVLTLCNKIATRATLDVHHYECYRSMQTDYMSVTNPYFFAACKTWKNIRPLFHVSQTILSTNGEKVRANQHSDILHDRDRLAALAPLLEYADFEVEAKHKEVAVQDAYSYLLDEELYAGEPIQCKQTK